jgi:hypothetical protein
MDTWYPTTQWGKKHIYSITDIEVICYLYGKIQILIAHTQCPSPKEIPDR